MSRPKCVASLLTQDRRLVGLLKVKWLFVQQSPASTLTPATGVGFEKGKGADAELGGYVGLGMPSSRWRNTVRNRPVGVRGALAWLMNRLFHEGRTV